MMDTKEKRFEHDIESFLLSPAGGYTKGDLSTYDKKQAIDMPKLIQYIKATQPNEWKKYNAIHGSDSENKLFKRTDESIKMHGMIHVLRHGIMDRGVKVIFASFKEVNHLNPDVVEKYNANILTCTRQFMYSADNKNSIDMVLSLNGFPLITLELKKQLTGQSVDNAKRQYNDRDPKELCFQFDSRFLVYFAVDLYEVCMTTKLDRKKTVFHPFNQGSNGAGKNYLIQHSAGSGKSNSIAWLAYGLSELHSADDKKIFKSVIVITDRTVLDGQLQDTIGSFDHKKGVVEKIDEKMHSSDLRDAINEGKQIIITTLQKFPDTYKEIDNTKDKNFALIVDEAYSSQTGQNAMKLKAALTDTEEAA